MLKPSPSEQAGGRSRIAGRATDEATAAYASRFPGLQPAFGPLGSTGLIASHAGFGCYRVDYRVAAHVQALEQALTSGVNVIDTSANYGDGNSEQLIAAVLETLIARGQVRRDEVIIVTKGGYIQGQNYDRAVERAQRGSPFPEVVEYDRGLWHCLHPEFLDDQLHRSMERMNVEHVDVYLLHNPEYYLSWAAKHGRSVDSARQEYDRRIRAAFEWLETQAAAGTISSYGISSNTFPRPSTDADFTSLEQIYAIAEAISSVHHFRVIQLPINLFERGGVLEQNQGNGTETALEFARRQGL
ncbi:MAG: aldo/keto reductase, partial [Candidatus Latescibacteria bacterium]|nr:aldo/keto reductase [Candidatus Latescibacterota bacterium]